jgi:hypothetical protein
VREAVERHGVMLVGTLDDLPVAPPGPEVPKELPAPSQEELLDAAATAVDGLRAWSKLLGRALDDGTRSDAFDSITTQLADPGAVDPADATSPDRWAAEPDPVRAAVLEITALLRTCMELRKEVGALEPTGLTTPVGAE